MYTQIIINIEKISHEQVDFLVGSQGGKSLELTKIVEIRILCQHTVNNVQKSCKRIDQSLCVTPIPHKCVIL